MMASNLVFDFRHHYVVGERRASEPSAYQFDQGHLAEIYVPENATSWEIHYAFGDFPLSEGYNVDDVEAADDGGYVITAHVPNDLFERSGELRVYLMAVEEESIITTYEGYVFIKNRNQPDDYVDDDPDNHATHLLEEAEAAAALAQEAAESIINYYPTETAQGNPATFDDGADGIPVKDLKVSIVPTQDLHGYDKPWAGGAGKNLLPMTVDGIKAANTGTWSGNSLTSNGITWIIQTDSDGNVLGIAISGTATAQVALVICQNVSISADTLYVNGVGTGASNNTHFINLEYSGGSNENITGDTTITGKTVTKALIYVRSGQSVNVTYKPMIRTSGDATFAPYTNECPITGMTEVEVERRGKNLLDDSIKDIGTFSGVTVSQNDKGQFILNGTATADNYIRVGVVTLPAGSYVLSGMKSTGSGTTFFLNIAPQWGGTSNQNLYSGEYSGTSDTERQYTVRINYRSGQSFNNVVFEPMIRLASVSDATFAPYSKQTVTTDLGRTVYGGVLDATTGVLTVDRGFATLTANNVLAVSGNNKRFSLDISGAKPSSDTVASDKLSSNLFPAKPSYDTYNGVAGVSISSAGTVSISLGYDVTIEDAKQFVTDNTTQICYPIATPATYQLTPQELLSVLGTNHISTDAESVEVVYRADIALYIENLTEPDADMIADTNITSGSYFMVGNTLYLATANIANGSAIIVGTNCTRSNLASALNAINA